MPLQFLGAGGLVLEFELGGAADWLSTAVDASTDWHISDVRVQASVININSQLNEAYSAHVLSGKPLLIPYKSFTCTSSALPDSDDFDVSIARNFTRLCTLFQTSSTTGTATAKEVNTYYSPVTATTQDEIQSVLHIGSKRWSDFDRIGSAQHYYYLLQALGYANSMVSSANIGLNAYKSNSAIFAWGVEKVPQAIMSGYNTSGGQTLTTSWKNMGTETANRPKKTVFVSHYDCVLGLSSTSAQVHSSNKWDNKLHHSVSSLVTIGRGTCLTAATCIPNAVSAVSSTSKPMRLKLPLAQILMLQRPIVDFK